MSRSDVKQFGDFIDPGHAGLVVVGENTVEDAIRHAVTRAEKETLEKLGVDPKDIDRVMREAMKEIACVPRRLSNVDLPGIGRDTPAGSRRYARTPDERARFRRAHGGQRSRLDCPRLPYRRWARLVSRVPGSVMSADR
jgi:hypothetical protein